jgi:hypothetical protein
MYPKFNTQSSQSIVVRKRLSDEHIISHPSLGADGFNIWWQKTAAQNRSMVTEASELMRAHRLVCSARQPYSQRTQRVIESIMP